MARTLSKENLLANASFMGKARRLYNIPENDIAERYSRLTEGLDGNIFFFSSPGRAELVGNHTDHNHGFVISSAIDLDVIAAAVKTQDGKITIDSAGYPVFTVDTAKLDVNTELYGTSIALVQGVLKGFLNRGKLVGGFRAKIESRVFKGAGVSSSAAFELLICEILNKFYNDGKLDFVEKALISQFAENVYFGKPSGLMDQLTISRGGVSFMDFKDAEMPVSEPVEWKFDDISIVIINCGGDHSDLTDEYSAIRHEMGLVAKFFNKSVLREVSYEEFSLGLPALINAVSGRAILRAMHFFNENERVLSAKKALAQGDKAAFLSLISASGDSSYRLLQNCYPAGDAGQRIPLALAIAQSDKRVIASRVHGGGFAGTILAFTDKQESKDFGADAELIFGKGNVFAVSVRRFGAICVEE